MGSGQSGFTPSWAAHRWWRDSAYALLAVMLSFSLVALFAALYVLRLDRQEHQGRPP
jgi:hypothetical protein